MTPKLLLAAALFGASLAATAQSDFPSRPITMLVPRYDSC